MCLLALGVVASSAASAHAAVPTTVGFTARLVDDKTGDAVTGSHHLTFELFDAATAGSSVWMEGRDVEIEDGLLFADLGSSKPLDAAVFDGRRLFLQVSLDEVVMEPRIALDSVPYAIRAGVASEADAVGGLTAADLQPRITGACGAGNFVIGVNPDGSVVCAPDLSGSGDVTDVVAGSGLQGGGTGGSVTLSMLLTCAASDLLKWNGSAWVCAPDAVGAGDVTSVTVGAAGGLSGGGTAGDVALSLLTTCTAGQLLKFNGSSWGCATDVDTDTNSGGDITGVLTGGNSGLVGGTTAGDAALSLLTNCVAGQLLKWNGTAWGCANDADTNAGGDITDVLAGNGLVGGGNSGPVSLDVVAGPGLTAVADNISLDTTFTDARYDPRYVNVTGDTMTGALNMGQQRVTNVGCPAGYVRMGPGLCIEDIDVSGQTFTGCSNRCRVAGTHLCSSAEMRAAMSSGVTIGNGGVAGDWVDDQDALTSAFFINSGTDIEAMAVRPTTTAGFCRCCANVE